jgi:hypothetical protein
MWDLLQERQFTDVRLVVEDRTYDCHKVVLGSVKGYFRDLFLHDFREKQSGTITIRTRDPYEHFPLVLKSIYTGDLSFVKDRNAIPLHALALYLRLPNLRAAAEQKFCLLHQLPPSDLIDQISQVAYPVLPESLVELLAGAFPHICEVNQCLYLPRESLLRVLTHPSLRIASDRQLVQFISSAHSSEGFSENALKRLTAAVQWTFLTKEDWGTIDYSLFGVTDETRHSLLDQRSRLAEMYPYVNVALALQSGDAAGMIRRYDPPLATFFGLDDGFFMFPKKFHVSNQYIVEKSDEIILFMDQNAGLFVAEFEFVVASFRSVSFLFLQFMSAIDEPDATMDCGYDNVDGRAVFRVKPCIPRLCREIRIAFMVEQNNRFILESKKARGFVTCW